MPVCDERSRPEIVTNVYSRQAAPFCCLAAPGDIS
jgi:hypothetical protein